MYLAKRDPKFQIDANRKMRNLLYANFLRNRCYVFLDVQSEIEVENEGINLF
jgi:hypothetical protein